MAKRMGCGVPVSKPLGLLPLAARWCWADRVDGEAVESHTHLDALGDKATVSSDSRHSDKGLLCS